ncbi:MAG: helix-turn-helix domain-containing protein, partial [Clostridia bacterium]|nr:helix-turn-helix domain-containing protein [Clostridia bacterium]
MSSIGERISNVRKVRGYTQDQLAERMHVSRQAISHWENERALPDFESIKQLSQVLGYDFSSEDEGIAGSRFESNVSGTDNPLSGDFSSENGEAAGKRLEPKTAGTGGLPPTDGSRRGRRGKWWALAGVVCLLMVAVVAGWRFSKRAAAEVAVRPLSPVV